MKRIYPLFLVFALMFVLWGVSVPALAEDNFEPTTLAEVRSTVDKIFAQLHTFDNQCVVILPAQIKEVDIQVLHLRKLITTGKIDPSLPRQVFNSIETGVSIYRSTLTQCRMLLGFGEVLLSEEVSGSILNELYHILEGVSFLCEFNQLDARKCNKILSILRANIGINFVGVAATGIFPQIINKFLKEAEIGCGLVKIGPIEPSTPAEWRFLNSNLGRLHNFYTCLEKLYSSVAQYKKWLYKGLREIYNLLRASNFGGRASATLSQPSTRIYTLGGRLIELQFGGLNTARLANGVYLAVTENVGVDRTKVRKIRTIVVAH